MDKKKIEVKCPKCKSKFSYYESEFRPFCSKRCKDIDLGKWLSEDYAIEGSETVTDDEEFEGESH